MLQVSSRRKETSAMQTTQTTQLFDLVRQKTAEFKSLCEGLDEETASRAPTGRWSPKEIVSHLCGPEGTGMMPTFRAFIEEDIPQLDIEAENAFFSEARAHMTLDELLTEFDREYGSIAAFVEDLSEDQLSRKAHIPMLKESPLGEYPTLAAWIQGIGAYHLGMHIDHMREIMEVLGVTELPHRTPVTQESQGLHAD
jgi:hypothetical protein